jgi:hypothetical protein
MGGRRASRDHWAVKARLLALAMLALVVLALGGCAVPGPAIDVTQRGVFVPSARVSIGRETAEAPSRLQPGAAFELALGRVAGKGPQTLYVGEGVELGEGALTGARQLENESDVRIADAWLRVRTLAPGQTLGHEMLVGLSLINADFTLRSGAQSVTDNWTTQGLSLGMGVFARAPLQTMVHARYSFTLTGRAIAQTHIHRLEVAGVRALGRHVAARAGYSWWAIDATPPTGSEITVRLSGPMLGLEASF